MFRTMWAKKHGYGDLKTDDFVLLCSENKFINGLHSNTGLLAYTEIYNIILA